MRLTRTGDLWLCDRRPAHRASALSLRSETAEDSRSVAGLRTLDALQLAVALDMLEASWISTMLSADKRLCEVAEVYGCPAIDPAEPGLVQG